MPLLVGAGRDDGAAAALSTRLVQAGAEQQRVAQLPRDPLKELPQGLRPGGNSFNLQLTSSYLQ